MFRRYRVSIATENNGSAKIECSIIMSYMTETLGLASVLNASVLNKEVSFIKLNLHTVAGHM